MPRSSFIKNNHVIVCDKVKYYADPAFRRRGIFRRRWGTGRSRGLGLAEMLLGVAFLGLSLLATQLVANLKTAHPRSPAAVAPYVNRGGGHPGPYMSVPRGSGR